MRFLMQYTPANPLKGPPSPEMLAKMGAFMQASVQSGVLIATGTVKPSAANGMRVKLANAAFDVTAGSPAQARRSGGWAILNVDSQEHLEQVTRQFLETAGDGDVEILEITQVPLS
jgi:hypothetical protein